MGERRDAEKAWVEALTRMSDDVASILAGAREEGFDPRAVADRAIASLEAAARREAGLVTEPDVEVAAVLAVTGLVDRDRLGLIMDIVRVATDGAMFAEKERRVARAVACGAAFAWTQRQGRGVTTRIEAAAGVAEGESGLPSEVEDLASALADLSADEAAAVSRRLDEDAPYARWLMVDPDEALAAYREDADGVHED